MDFNLFNPIKIRQAITNIDDQTAWTHNKLKQLSEKLDGIHTLTKSLSDVEKKEFGNISSVLPELEPEEKQALRLKTAKSMKKVNNNDIETDFQEII